MSKTLGACDVAIVGGGPAGSVCAAQLALVGRRVALFERERHPRFHLGESLLPQSLAVLESIGVLQAVRDRFLVKRGARFVDGNNPNRVVRYALSEAFRQRYDHAFQVPRDEFDELLFRHAGAKGAELLEGCEVTRVVFEADRAVGVEGRGPDGAPLARSARFVVDATGRDALLARTSLTAGSIRRIPGLDRTALFTQVRGAWRDSGEREGDIQVVLFGQAPELGWIWLIPFVDGRTSVGAVVSGAWIRERRSLGGPEELLRAALEQAPAASQMLERAHFLFSPKATADFSFRVSSLRGAGWVAIGDAAGFIDPLFSTGAHLAMYGALRAANSIDAALDTAGGEASLQSWEDEMRDATDFYVGAVQAFYRGELSELLFAPSQHQFLRRGIVSMLSGDVFDKGKVWIREMSSRFPAQTSF